ncbi:hypothetical protein L914_20592 [Phytophthora nicotianae]|uniref:Uncharacterized protein n=1 Tax=Phytophthora nicotianae TaxID=4792 RepID=W2M6H1_PHYNI|nr:hypothetical protein L914_20592 [Phytophthora nicotianae]
MSSFKMDSSLRFAVLGFSGTVTVHVPSSSISVPQPGKFLLPRSHEVKRDDGRETEAEAAHEELAFYRRLRGQENREVSI